SVELCRLVHLEFTVNGSTLSFHTRTLRSSVALKNAAAYDDSLRSYAALTHVLIKTNLRACWDGRFMNEPVGRIPALKFLLAARQTTHAYSRDSHEQREWMAEKKNINVVEFAQPSIDTGNIGIGGLGRPNVPHKQTLSAVSMPIIVPISLAPSVNIPRVKIPKIGPPIEP
ncbi:hypothetical protein ALC62_02709, partial [Cyphomyrmex costatus]